MTTTTPKYLIKKFPEQGIGIIHLWTPLLSKRSDMTVYNGVPPSSMRVKLTLENSGSDTTHMIDLDDFPPDDSIFSPNTPSLLGADHPISAVPGIAATAAKEVDAVHTSTSTGADIAAGADADAGKEPEALKTPGSAGDAAWGASENPDNGRDLTPCFTPEQKHARLVEIIGTWEPGDPERFTNSGLPRLDSLMAALGADVETRERDAAWAAFTARATGSGQAE